MSLLRHRQSTPLLRAALLGSVSLVSLTAAHDAHAKPIILMQEGIALYEDVSRELSRRLGEATVKNLDDLQGPSDLEKLVETERPSFVVIVGVGAARMASAAKLKLPLVSCLVPRADVRGLADAQGTGVSLEVGAAEQLDAISSVVPAVKKIGVLFDPAHSAALLAELKTAGAATGIQIVDKAVSSASEIGDALQTIIGSVDAIWMVQDRTVGTAIGFKILLVQTLERKIPLISYSGTFVESGALLSLAPDFSRMAAEAADLALRLGSGKQVKDLPWRPGPGQLVVNGRVAERLGIRLPSPTPPGMRIVQ